MTRGQRVVYWLDRHTEIFGRIESARADWFGATFPLGTWFQAGESVLDIGSGVGDITSLIHVVSGAEVTGIDIEDYRRRGTMNSPHFVFRIADAYGLPFEDQSFDSVTLFWILHHLTEPDRAIHEALRVLRGSGSLIIIEDVVEEGRHFRKWFTRVYDNLVNLEFGGNPHSNRSLKDWNNSVIATGLVELLEMRSKRWLTPLKLLTLGTLRYRKKGL